MLKVYLAGKVHPENKENVERKANELDRTVSYTLDIILSEYFSEKNTGEVA